MDSSQGLTVSIIIPVYNGGEKFRHCLSSVAACTPPPEEVIVVADGDTDGSWRVAGEYGTQVLRIHISGGPARARNLGAGEAKGDILFFVDADVTVPQDAISQVTKAFQEDPELSAIFGSYDDAPFETNFLSQYKNLFHHYVHQNAKEEASTFWAACGAIRREVFSATGGFDKAYRRPSIEDIELGYRLRRAGYRIRLLKGLKVKHLKRWGIASFLRADFFYRALPWTDLILREGKFIDDLNVTISNRLSVIFTYVFCFALLGSWWMPWLFPVALLAMIGLLVIHWNFYRFFKDKHDLGFAAKTIPWHWFYFFYGGLAFAIGSAKFHLERLRS
ncbi:MAG: glycosyltransferase [Deltaproteobacteria bacterium]|nr:glycosyltransferase [Deltaproteobacteria bacterium]